MATTTTSAFVKFRHNLEITDLQAATVSTRQQRVREAVARSFTLLDSFLTGSYRRSTMIAPLKDADIDVMVVLDASYYKNGGQAALLDSVRQALFTTYPSTPRISRNGHAVTITFTDFVVDVVPSFSRKGGGFLIPDSVHGCWVSTDPRVHEQVMTGANTAHSGNLVPVIKMIKCWNREMGDAFRSFYLELAAVVIFNSVTLSNDSSAVRYFFDKGRERIKTKILDPAGFGDQINGLQSTRTVAEAVARFQTAYDRALRVEAYEREGRTSLAIQEWIKIFGGSFPAYG